MREVLSNPGGLMARDSIYYGGSAYPYLSGSLTHRYGLREEKYIHNCFHRHEFQTEKNRIHYIMYHDIS